MSKMTDKHFLNHPARKCFDEYGHSCLWTSAVDYKERSDGNYIVLLFKDPYDEYFYAHLAGDGRGHWEMQDDGNPITLDEWKEARIAPHCDWMIDKKGNVI